MLGCEKPSVVICREFPSLGFQVEVVKVDYDGPLPTKPKADSFNRKPKGSSDDASASAINTIVKETRYVYIYIFRE